MDVLYRELSLHFIGSFHLLHILLEDYIVYCVECKAACDQTSQSVDLEDKQGSSEKENGEFYMMIQRS